ncbi:hypothetical protein Tco_0940253 [Tanacetum coccineum]|uniref:Uncharacterized protein n=1 Tax=Tanacetum coccineum TaxID=301880 RepID=A0ABQ5DNF0_9ASTR
MDHKSGIMALFEYEGQGSSQSEQLKEQHKFQEAKTTEIGQGNSSKAVRLEAAILKGKCAIAAWKGWFDSVE